MAPGPGSSSGWSAGSEPGRSPADRRAVHSVAGRPPSAGHLRVGEPPAVPYVAAMDSMARRSFLLRSGGTGLGLAFWARWLRWLPPPGPGGSRHRRAGRACGARRHGVSGARWSHRACPRDRPGGGGGRRRGAGCPTSRATRTTRTAPAARRRWWWSARRRLAHAVSLAGTLDNCAGGPTWGTWLTCEETDEGDRRREARLRVRGRPARPATCRHGAGSVRHEAVASTPGRRVYLTEDADTPFGYVYRFRPRRRQRKATPRGGELRHLRILDLDGTDLSAVTEAAPCPAG